MSCVGPSSEWMESLWLVLAYKREDECTLWTKTCRQYANGLLPVSSYLTWIRQGWLSSAVDRQPARLKAFIYPYWVKKELTPAKSAKDLGVILNPNLTYEDHITKAVSTWMSQLDQIDRVKHVLDKDTLTIVVSCLVFSKLYYCSNVLSNTTESNLDKGQKVQNFACRIISGVKKFDHITPVLRAMQWLPIRQQLYYNNAVIAFNCMAGCAPERLMDQFIKRSDVSTRTSRNSQKLQIPFLESATGQRSFYYRTVKIWNALDPLLILSRTL